MALSPIRGLPANVWVLAASQALALSAVPMMILVSGLLAADIAPDAKLVTLPMALVVVGTACSTVPVALSMKRLGRKRGGYIGFAFGLCACMFGYLAAANAAFPLLLVASLCLGVAVAFGQQFRFAALESVKDPARYGPALSVFMTGGLVAAILGPEIGARGESLLASPHGFAGSFVLMAGVFVSAATIFSFFRETAKPADTQNQSSRSLREIARKPAFLIAVSTAAVSYMVMSFIMTATPITMYELCGFSLTETKRVIQSHIFAMFLPSLFSGWLMKAFGAGKLMIAGLAAFAIVLVVGLWGRELIHFWLSLVLLGIGWNFLFVSGTALLPLSYGPTEKFKAQAMNDFIIFGCQALASLSAGWFLFSFGWEALLLSCIPAMVIAAGAALMQFKNDRTAQTARLREVDEKKPATAS